MKKYILILLIILLVGCSDKEDLKCERNFYNDGLNYKEKIVVKMANDKVSSLKSYLTFESEENASSYCDSLKKYIAYNNINIEYECIGNEIEVNNYEKYIAVDNPNTIIGLSREEFIKLFTEFKYACQ